MMTDFHCVRPSTVEAAMTAVADGGVPYAGGTELVGAMRMGLLSAPVLVDLKRVEGLSGVRIEERELVVGATTTHREVSASEGVRRFAGLLATAAHVLGNQRVRATGTVAGNICFAEPRSDVLTAIVALDAQITLRSLRGTRRVPARDFVEAGFTTVRADDELMLSVHVPRTSARSYYTRFQPAEYPTLAVALVVQPDNGGCRVVVGAVGEHPQWFDVSSLADVDADGIAQQVDVLEDLNGAEDYKRHLVGVFVRRAVAEARADA